MTSTVASSITAMAATAIASPATKMASTTKPPHILFVLFDDYGWADAGWHRNYTAPGGVPVAATKEISTPNLDRLVKSGIELDRAYTYKFCSPSRSAIQSGRNPFHVNPLNAPPDIHNPSDPVSGYAAIPRNMTGIATKLKGAGYRTAFFGKWDAGMATPDHTPHGRGYDVAVNYFHHLNDYWSMTQSTCQQQQPPQHEQQQQQQSVPIVDLWACDETGHEGPAHGMNNTCSGAQPRGSRPASCRPGPHGDPYWDGYEDSLFESHVLKTIETHDPTTPLFLFWAPHIVHSPLQVPQQYIDQFDFMAKAPWGDNGGHRRTLYSAMVHYADAMVGNATQLLQSKGMWSDTLMVFSTDNGGPIYYNGSAGANNYPLRGGKMNNWEGGVRGNSFVSGGFLPPSVRGTKFEGLVALWDWYGTFASLAGVDPTDHRAALANLPPIDSYDLTPVLMGRAKGFMSPRRELVIGTDPRPTNLTTAPLCSSYNRHTPRYDDDASRPSMPSTGRCTTASGLIVDERSTDGGRGGGKGGGALWKLLTGPLEQYVYVGPYYPNASTNFRQEDLPKRDCANGCLYDLQSDPLEAVDLATTHPDKLKELYQKLEAHEATAFNPDRGVRDPKACEMALGPYGGFWGPFVDVASN